MAGSTARPGSWRSPPTRAPRNASSVAPSSATPASGSRASWPRSASIDSYAAANAFPYSFIPSHGSSAKKVLRDPEQMAWRNRLYDALAGPNLQAIIAFGEYAQYAVDHWPTAPAVPIHRLPHPSSHSEPKLLDAWRAAVTALRGQVTPDPGAPDEPPELRRDLRRIRLRADPAPRPPVRRAGLHRERRVGPRDRRPRQRQPARRAHHRVAGPQARRRRQPPTLMPTRYVLTGRIVTVDPAWTVHASGALYIADDRIVRVQDAAAAPPPDFDGAPRIATKGTIYPGLIELHNHLSYNALPLWPPLKVYENRGQWAGIEPYRKSVSGPMTVLGKTLGLPQAVVRYVECKCLVAGVTTSQGVALVQQQRDPEVLPRQHPQRRGHARGRPRRCADEDRRRRGDQGQGLPDPPQEDAQADPPPGRRARADRARPLHRPPPGR